MEEPLDLFEPPRDEAERQALPLGAFTGCEVAAGAAAGGGDSLEALLGEGGGGSGGGVTVTRVVENSPADAAGLQVGDVLLEAGLDGAPRRALDHPSAWRELELAGRADQRLQVRLDRANRQAETTIRLIDRVRPPTRGAIERLREERRVGVVVRTATEVEARAAGLGPGGGAVVVGLAKGSPWRDVGLRFGDLITAVDRQPVQHPSVVVEAIRAADDALELEWIRAGERASATVPLSRRAHEMHEIYLPLLFSYESDRGETETSLLLGLIHHHSTEAAWRLRLLWFLSFGGGDADRLIEVDE